MPTQATKAYRPRWIAVCRLHAQGYSNQEIADKVGYSVVRVSQLLNSEFAKDMQAQLLDRTLNTMLDVQTEMQSYAPMIVREKIRLALEAKSESVRDRSCRDILEMAGNGPVKRLHIERAEVVEDPYKDLSEKDLREKLLEEIHGASDKTGTLH